MKLPFTSGSALTIFLAVVIVGTFWRLTSMHLAASDNPTAKNLGQAMSLQY